LSRSRSKARFLVVAHRGASKECPENTLAAFKRALEHGADGIELDVQLTRDGEVVVLHDEQVDRTTDGRGWVRDLTLAEVRRLDAGDWFAPGYAGERVPTLPEVFQVAGRAALVNVELKNNKVRYDGLERKVLDIVKTAGLSANVVISSFNHASLRVVQSLDSSQRIATLHPPGPWRYPVLCRLPARAALAVGAEAAHLPHRTVSRRTVAHCHNVGIDVRTWTVNAAEEVERAVADGVDAVFTDDPGMVRKLLERF
jgi:glycerophosphoryl diester phosphodiesterase